MPQYNSYISQFLKIHKKPALLCIVGPTGSGKTKLSLEIAKQYNGEIINADSKQVYKNIEITSGQIPKEEQENISHHLFGYIDPSITYTVMDHCNDALSCIQEIHKQNKLPILTGGTGLFINALTQNFDLPSQSLSAEIRKELEEKDNDTLWEELLKVDPEYTKITHKNNRVRVIRALEVFLSTGEKKSEISRSEEIFDVLILMPEIKSREDLYEKINARAKEIWNSGTIKEAQNLLERVSEKKLEKTLPALTAIGIPEAFDYLENKTTEEEAIEKMQQKSRNYAKRQMTWWRKDSRVILI